MSNETNGPRELLRHYAECLIANSGSRHQTDQDLAADALIRITGLIEARGDEVANMLLKCLGEDPPVSTP